MSASKSWATWLDLAMFASNEPSTSAASVEVKTVRISPQPCYMVALQGRDVRSSNGSWTIFRDMDSVSKFLEALNISRFTVVDATDSEQAVPPSTYECVELVQGTLTVASGPGGREDQKQYA